MGDTTFATASIGMLSCAAAGFLLKQHAPDLISRSEFARNGLVEAVDFT
jgi:hypothetical protein